MNTCLVNGKPDKTISILDRGLAYGHGLFETLLAENGDLPHWDRHWRRLVSGCQKLGFTLPDEKIIRREAEQLIGGQRRIILKIILTAGNDGRGYHLDWPIRPQRILYTRPWSMRLPSSGGAVLKLCKTRLPIDPWLAGLKHLNRLHSVLARAEWQQRYDEGLLRDVQGHIIEGTMSNVFWVEGGVLYTPDLNRSGVAGIMRERVLERASGLDTEVQVEDCSLERLLAADGIFVCNSIIGIWPVSRIENMEINDYWLVGQLVNDLAAGRI